MIHETHRRGAATEYIAAAHFIEKGFEVFWPAVNSSTTDFLVLIDGVYRRIQVKAAGWVKRHKHQYLRAKLVTTNGEKYRKGDFDILVVVHGSRLWRIPASEVIGRSVITLDNSNPRTRKQPEWRIYETVV